MGDNTEIEFKNLVDAHYQALFRFGLSLSGNEHDASDLVQETFTVFAKKGDTIRDHSKAKTWLFTTLYRQFLRQVRKNKRVKLDAPDNLADQEILSVEPDVVRALDGDAAIDALQRVSEIYRDPLTLFYLQHFSYREIGEIIDIPIGTVMSRIARGKSELKTILQTAKTPNR